MDCLQDKLLILDWRGFNSQHPHQSADESLFNVYIGFRLFCVCKYSKFCRTARFALSRSFKWDHAAIPCTATMKSMAFTSVNQHHIGILSKEKIFQIYYVGVLYKREFVAIYNYFWQVEVALRFLPAAETCRLESKNGR